jgi:uncharacterized protein (TIGR02145 family)
MRYKKIKLSAVFVLCLGLTAIHAQTVKDIDGNVYKTVTIGAQTWIVENLKTTRFRNGDLIGTTSPPYLDISNVISSSQYQWAYDGKESYVATYGRLYTWYAVTDSRGVCPTGWHVATDAEWSTLTTFLGGEVVAYSKLKESGKAHWIKYDTGTNELGFTALPGGLRNSSGSFVDIGSRGSWWSSTEQGAYDAWYRLMDYNFNSVYRHLNLKQNGLSVRCVKN